MTMGTSPIVAVFTEQADAGNAVNDLQTAGFDSDQISFLAPGTVRGSFFTSIKNFFKEGTAHGDVDDELMKMGVPEQEAQYCQNQYDAGRTLLIVQAPAARRDQALDIIRENQGYDAASGARA